jgi:hypothetical protein
MAKLIRLQDFTYRRLSRHGRYGDTMDSIITRMLDDAEGKESEVASSRNGKEVTL